MNSNKCMRNAFYSRLDIVLKGNVYKNKSLYSTLRYGIQNALYLL